MSADGLWGPDEIEPPRGLGAVIRGLGVHMGEATFVSVDEAGEQWIEVGEADAGYVRRGDLTVHEVIRDGVQS